MLYKTIILSAIALFGAVATAAPAPATDAALIATDPYFACNCPNNCSHKLNSGCKYYSGPSDNSGVVSGKCAYSSSGALYCVAT